MKAGVWPLFRVLLLAVGAIVISPAAGAAGRPNILFLLTDDQRWNALGCMGDPNAVTPHVDRLAHAGVLFQNHFVTTAICGSSRASIFTGQYMRRHGIELAGDHFTPEQWTQTYPALLRQHGYFTGFIGKFGVGGSNVGAQFDYWRGLPGQGGKYFIEPGDTNRLHKTALFGNQALEFLGQVPSNRPFCLSISFNAPHARDGTPQPYMPDDRDVSLYAEKILPAPSNATKEFHDKLPKSVQESEAHRRWQERFSTPEKYQANVKDYYRLITGIDREVGRILSELDARGLTKNTVVIYTSDNGYALGDRQLEGKWFMYEENFRDPLIIYDPRETAAHRNRNENAMTLNIDFAPTMLDLAGLTPPAGMQGRSLLPLVRGERPADWRTEFFYEHHFGAKALPPSEGVRTERWSYIRWVNESPVIEELYDVQADPLEGHNLAGEPEFAPVLKQLRASWERKVRELK